MPRRNRKQLNRRQPIQIGCGTKRRYASREEARKVAEIQELQDMSLELYVYECAECHKWHLTRQQRTNKKH